MTRHDSTRHVVEKRYTNEILEQYRRDGKAKAFDSEYQSPLPPHVYAIADNAYRLMNNPTSENQKRNQSILVSSREKRPTNIYTAVITSKPEWEPKWEPKEELVRSGEWNRKETTHLQTNNQGVEPETRLKARKEGTTPMMQAVGTNEHGRKTKPVCPFWRTRNRNRHATQHTREKNQDKKSQLKKQTPR